jgi:transcriptional regulator with XRE-family HTH domain
MQKMKKMKRVERGSFPLKSLLERLGWSQRKLALASGISVVYVNRLAQGRISPTWATVLLICTTIGADLGDLKPMPEAPKPKGQRRRTPEPAAA